MDPLGTPTHPDYWSEGAPSPGSCNDEFIDCIADLADCQSYYLSLPVTVPSQTIDSVFSPGMSGVSHVTKTDYSYDTYGGVYFLKQKKTTINNNKTTEQSYKYAFTANSDFKLGLTAAEQIIKDTLKNRNYLQPIEVVDSIKTNGTSPQFLTGAKYIFTNTASKLRLSKFRNYTSASDSTELNFSAYDYRGNLTEQYKTNDVKEVYLWGYQGQFPVAKVVGSTYAFVSGLVSASILNNPSSDAALRTELDKIRTALANSQAQVTTYTYSKIYGSMTSMTTPEGKLTTYEYDAFGRLQNIKDANGNIIKRYSYSLANPQ